MKGNSKKTTFIVNFFFVLLLSLLSFVYLTKTDILNKQQIPSNEGKIIDFISADASKVASVILKKASKNKGRIVIGKDAHFMSFLYRFFPSLAPKIITKFLKSSKFETFKDI